VLLTLHNLVNLQITPVSGVAATAQGQTTSAAGTASPASVSGTVSTSQAQTSTIAGAFTAVGGVVGTLVSAQAQTSSASGTTSPAAVSGTLVSSQGQTTAATGSTAPASVSGTVATAQGQTSAATGNASPASVTGTAATSQAQTSNISGSFAASSGVTGVVSTSQGQSTVASGSVVNPELPALQPAGRPSKSKKVFIEKDGKYLIFENESEARSYEVAQKKKDVAIIVEEVVQLPQLKSPEIIPVVDNKILDDLIARFNLEYNRQLLQKQKDYEQLIFIQNHVAMLQDEEDIEILLLMT
jgi:hypothetical protein